MKLRVTELPEEAQQVLAEYKEFELEAFDGSGSNGYVLLGKHKLLEIPVAIKIYFHEEDDIHHEPAIIAALEHNNILKVFEARSLKKGCSFFVMPYADSGSLADYVRSGPLPIYEAHKLLCDLLSGLSCLHSGPNFLVHRDIKPENLLVDDGKLLIGDFGSVKKIGSKIGSASVSKNSVLFRPPESFGSPGKHDFASDVYQAGLVGFVLFGGRLENDLLLYLTKREILELDGIPKTDTYACARYVDSRVEARICSGKLVNFDSLPIYTSQPIRRILKKALSPGERRYADVSEFLVDLVNARRSLPDWSQDAGGYLLNGWNGFDYRIDKTLVSVSVQRRKHGTDPYRHEKTMSATSEDLTYELLKKKLGLPN